MLVLTGEDRIARRELLRAVSARAAEMGLENVHLRAHPLDAGAPYGALHPWLTRWYRTRAPESEPAEGKLDATFLTALAGVILGEGEGPAPTVAAALETEEGPARPAEPPPMAPEEVRAGLLSLVEDRSRRRPAVVTIEEGEYLDSASRDWLGFLSRRLPELPLVVVISLDPRAPGIEAWQRELGQVGTTWERWPPHGSSRGEEVPYGRRLRGLSPDGRKALAAVVLSGPEATSSLLRDVLGWKEDRLTAALKTVQADHWVELVDDRWALLEPALYPDLAGDLSSSEGAALHRAIAKVMSERRKRWQGPPLFRLAEHWAGAGEVGPGVETLRSSATEADRAGSPELAERALRRALVLAQGDPTPSAREMEEQLYEQLAVSRTRAGDSSGSVDAYRRAMTLVQEHGVRPVRWARLVAGLSGSETRLGHDPEPLLKEALSKVEGSSHEAEATLLSALGYFYRERGRRELSQETMERACRLAERGSSAPLKVQSRIGAAQAYFFGGDSADVDRARRHLKRALEYQDRLEGTPEASLTVQALDGLAAMALTQGDFPEAVRYGEEAIAAARRSATRYDTMLVLGNEAELQLEVGNLRRARELAQELRGLIERFGLGEIDGNFQQLLLVEARIALARGAFGPARRHLDHLLAAAARSGTRYFSGQALVCLIDLEIQRGDLSAAEEGWARLEREGLLQTLPLVARHHLEEAEAKLHPRPSNGPTSP